MIIQHNITALNAHRQLSHNTSMVAKNLEKLSSGYKINRAGDDAAGLAISEKMRAQITGLTRAEANAQDGISLVQTAEGALTEVHDMLNRMVDLSTQAANGTLTDEDRQKIADEIKALKDEIDRVSKSTNFNGINLIDGSLSGGAVSGTGASVIGANVSTFKAAEVTGAIAIKANIADTYTLADDAIDTFNIDGQTLTIDWSKGEAKTVFDKLNADLSGASEGTIKSLAADLTNLFNNEIKAQGLSGSVKITAGADNKLTIKSENATKTSEVGFLGTDQTDTTTSLGNVLFGSAADASTGAANVATATKEFANATAANDKFTMTINGTQVDVTITDALARGTDMSDVAAKVETAIQTAVGKYNTAMGTTGTEEELTATDFTVEVNKNGGLEVKYNGEVSGVKFSFGEKVENGVAGTTASLLGLVGKSSASTGNGGLVLQVGDTADDFQKVVVSVGDMSTKGLGIDTIEVTEQGLTADALNRVKAAINTVSNNRSALGALQNRLEHTINNLGVTNENMTAAESRIRDTDMAKEMMAFTKNNVLIQAAQAMLAQANQQPQSVLQLLQ